jgi:2'-5' RNA ligase
MTHDDHSNGTIVMFEMQHHSAMCLHRWCQQHNIACINPEDLHLTVLFSHEPLAEAQALDQTDTHVTARIEDWRLLGNRNLTLLVRCEPAVMLHHRLLELGGSHNWPNFLPHVTCVYGYEKSRLPDMIPNFDLIFDKIMVTNIDPEFAQNRSR